MSIYKRNQKEIFNDFIETKHKIQSLAGIVQNEGWQPSNEILDEWSENLSDTVNTLLRLQMDVVEFYSNNK